GAVAGGEGGGGSRRAAHLARVADSEGKVLCLEATNLALDGRTVPHQDRGETEFAGRRDCSLDDDGGAEVPAHGVHRDLHRSRPARPVGTPPRRRELPRPYI